MRHLSRAPWLVALALCGCLNQGKQELIEVQLDATRTALSARQAACTEKVLGCQANVAALSDEVAARQAHLDALTEQLTSLRAEVQRLEAERAAWLAVQPDPLAPVEEDADTEVFRPIVDAAAEDMRAALEIRREQLARAEATAAHLTQATAAFAAITDAGRGELVPVGDAIMVRIPAGMLFNEGTTTLSPRGETIVEALAQGLSAMGHHEVQVVGHTDNLPVHTARHPSNWELGFDRAVSVVRALDSLRVPMTPVASSAAGAVPIATNDTPEGRKENARVEVLLRPAADVLDWYTPTPPEEAPAGEDAPPPEDGPSDDDEAEETEAAG